MQRYVHRSIRCMNARHVHTVFVLWIGMLVVGEVEKKKEKRGRKSEGQTQISYHLKRSQSQKSQNND
eukprot:scaffold1915_cov143-Skeletonema_menzelii.AAC.7